MECYQKRPDILMEASDINGELRLCMQIISTCKYEDENYGKCILDSMRDYHNLISHFAKVNTAVAHSQNNCLTREEKIFLEQNPLITPILLEIATKIYSSY